MNKLAKYFVVLAGLVGIAGFFLPLLLVTSRGITGEISTMQIVSGVDKPSDHFKGVKGIDMDSPEARAAVTELNANLEKARMIFVAMYVPSALLLLLGILAVAIRRFGRGIAAVTLVASLAALGIYALLQGVVSEVAKDGGSSALGIGGHLIVVSGAIALVFAVAALIKPETGHPVSARHKATIARPPV